MTVRDLLKVLKAGKLTAKGPEVICEYYTKINGVDYKNEEQLVAECGEGVLDEEIERISLNLGLIHVMTKYIPE
mgnify:CR=1 FL=1